MKKITCDECKDLLTLYVDNLCSNKSKELVEEHLKECSDCRNTYKSMTQEINIPVLNEKDLAQAEEFTVDLKKTWNKSLMKRAFIISGLALLVCGLIFFAVFMLVIHKYYIPADKIEIKEKCILRDNRIAIDLATDHERSFDYEIIPFDEVKNSEQGALYLVARAPLFNKEKSDEHCYIAIDTIIHDNKVDYNYDKIYYGLPSDENIKCIWIDGMTELSQATNNMSKFFNEKKYTFCKNSSSGDTWFWHSEAFNPDLREIQISYFQSVEYETGEFSEQCITARFNNSYSNKDGIIVHDDGTSLSFYFGTSESFLFSGEYVISDDRMVLTLNHSPALKNIGLKSGQKLIFYKNDKSEIDDWAKLNMFSMYSLPYYRIAYTNPDELLKYDKFKSDLVEFNYDIEDKTGKGCMAAKLKIEDWKKFKEYLEDYVVVLKSKKIKYDLVNYDWWKVNDKNVVYACKLVGYNVDNSNNSKSNILYVTKEGTDYYMYNCYTNDIK